MGCDMHGCVEYRSMALWWSLALIDPFPKDSDIFGVLAGVRSHRKPAIEPRGLPDDVNEDTRVTALDGHTHSWLTRKELERSIKCLPRRRYSVRVMRAVMKMMQAHPDKTRLVFWFSS